MLLSSSQASASTSASELDGSRVLPGRRVTRVMSAAPCMTDAATARRRIALRALDEPSKLTRMTAQTAAPRAGNTPDARVPMVGALRVLLIGEAIGGLVVAIFLSMEASVLVAQQGPEADVPLRFAAGGAFLLGIFALVASRGARRRRSWAWTMAAILQVIIAVATGIAVLAVEWHPAYLVAFGAVVAVMLVLSTTSVRRALGQP
jgi:hypothetical protein